MLKDLQHAPSGSSESMERCAGQRLREFRCALFDFSETTPCFFLHRCQMQYMWLCWPGRLCRTEHPAAMSLLARGNLPPWCCGALTHWPPAHPLPVSPQVEGGDRAQLLASSEAQQPVSPGVMTSRQSGADGSKVGLYVIWLTQPWCSTGHFLPFMFHWPWPPVVSSEWNRAGDSCAQSFEKEGKDWGGELQKNKQGKTSHHSPFSSQWTEKSGALAPKELGITGKVGTGSAPKARVCLPGRAGSPACSWDVVYDFTVSKDYGKWSLMNDALKGLDTGKTVEPLKLEKTWGSSSPTAVLANKKSQHCKVFWVGRNTQESLSPTPCSIWDYPKFKPYV